MLYVTYVLFQDEEARLKKAQRQRQCQYVEVVMVLKRPKRNVVALVMKSEKHIDYELGNLIHVVLNNVKDLKVYQA